MIIKFYHSLFGLFVDCFIRKLQTILITSPTPLQYDSWNPTFLKIEWSFDGMRYILMQPDTSKNYSAAANHLQFIGEYLFDRTSFGPRLMPVFFISRFDFDHERDYDMFLGNIAYGRWAI